MKINRLSNNLGLPRMIIQQGQRQRRQGEKVRVREREREGENALCVGEMCRGLSS